MIPAFNASGVLPPYVSGDPTQSPNMSPYETNILSFVDRFSISQDRINILRGFLNYRRALADIGILEGFQWLDGSFLENIEVAESRSPSDVDVVTFFKRPAGYTEHSDWRTFVNTNEELFKSSFTKATFFCDAYFVDMDIAVESLIDQTRFWFGLFSHQKSTDQWKGMVQIPLGLDPYSAVMDFLQTKEEHL